MAKFETVRFGENTPVSYDKLNYMMLNDQYNKDQLKKIPKGILATYKGGIFVLGSQMPSKQNINLSFTVDDSRLIKISVSCGKLDTVVAGDTMDLSLQIDGINVGPTATGIGAGIISGANDYLRPVAELVYVVSPALIKGVHTLDLTVSGKTSVSSNGVYVPASLVRIFVEDIGQYIDGS
jgi:hypothetical protein